MLFRSRGCSESRPEDRGGGEVPLRPLPPGWCPISDDLPEGWFVPVTILPEDYFEGKTLRSRSWLIIKNGLKSGLQF